MVFISESGTAINLDRANRLFKTRESRDLLDPETGEPIIENFEGGQRYALETYFAVWASFDPGDNWVYIAEFKTHSEAKNFIRWLATKIEPMKNPPPVNYDDYLEWLVKEAEKNGILVRD